MGCGERISACERPRFGTAVGCSAPHGRTPPSASQTPLPTPRMPAYLPSGSPDAFSITVRPALDSPDAAMDRMKMLIYTKFYEWGLPCPVTGHSSSSSGTSSDQQQPSPA